LRHRFQGGGYLEVAIHEFHLGLDVPIEKLYPDPSESWIENIVQIGRRKGPFRVRFRGPFLTLPLAPLGVNLAPRGEICPLGVKFTPSFTPRGEHSLLFRRMEGRTENFTPRG
jgi:hypothetical protein